MLDKVGVEPQVQRIGKFKSAGDQLLRTDMAPEQRQQLQALLDSVYDGFVSSVTKSRGKSEAQVRPVPPATSHWHVEGGVLALAHRLGPGNISTCIRALVQHGAA